MFIPKYPKIKTFNQYLSKPGFVWLQEYKEKQKSLYEYEDLNRHFTYSRARKHYKRLPRKIKKRLNKFLDYTEYYFFNSTTKEEKLNQKIWEINFDIHPNYNSFIIKHILENDKSPKLNHAGLNPKFRNEGGTQMTILERKEKYGDNWLY